MFSSNNHSKAGALNVGAGVGVEGDVLGEILGFNVGAGVEGDVLGDILGLIEGDVDGEILGLVVGRRVGSLVSNVSVHEMHCPSLQAAATHAPQSTKEKQHAAHAVHVFSSSEHVGFASPTFDAASAGTYSLSKSFTSRHHGPYCAFSG